MLRSGSLPSTLPEADAARANGSPRRAAARLKPRRHGGRDDDARRPSSARWCSASLIVDPGYVVFFTNYDSRKGAELTAGPALPRCSWDALGRCGSRACREVAAGESEAYFATRALDSRIGAWASLQSQPLDSRTTLLKRVRAKRPRHERAEAAPLGRLPAVARRSSCGSRVVRHDRARWQRPVAVGPHEFAPGG